MAQGFTQNSVFLSGNLTRDPEAQYTNNGTAYVKIGLAVNNRRKSGDQWVDDPCFVDVTYFGKLAEQISAGLRKGNSVSIEGRLQYRSWEAQDGTKHNKLEVVGDLIKKTVRFDEGTASGGSRVPFGDSGRDGPMNDDDVPF